MSFGQSVATVLKKYAVFKGRASRPEFWWYYLAYTIAALIIYFIDMSISAGGILIAVYALALFLPTLAVQIRRLHDSNKVGWWWWIGLIPIAGAIVLIVFYCQPSTPGDNRFGAPGI